MKNFVFLGDSITDAERLWIPEYNGLGNGYVQLLAEKLSHEFTVINKGHDSFTLPFLLRNLETDCLSFSPTAVLFFRFLHSFLKRQERELILAGESFNGIFNFPDFREQV